MNPTLSVVIACYNDPDIVNTVTSVINSCPPGVVEIVVVDDQSQRIICDFPNPAGPSVKIVRNHRRIGCGPSRYVGAQAVSGEFLLFCDAHMRFATGWYEAAMEKVVHRPKTLHCGRCLALGRDMDVSKPEAEFSGATFNLFGPYRGGPHKGDPRYNQVMECVWQGEQPGDDYEIPAALGACYFINREWFLRLDALRHLRVWGGDEQELSLKTWLAGGEVRLLKNVRIGHKFRQKDVGPGFKRQWHETYNKLFIAHTCLTEEAARIMQSKLMTERKPAKYGGFSEAGIALKRLQADWHLVAAARAHNLRLFERSFDWFLNRFELQFPTR